MLKFALVVLCLIGAALCDSPTDELLSVVVIFRHGDRTPIHPYPTDPYRNSSFWPVGFGQLTNAGKLREYQLGQWLRTRYDGFLPPLYSEKDIYVRSTDVDRTLMSAESSLAGLYPPQPSQTWDSNILWQPIPVHTKPEREDAVLAMKRDCPKYNELMRELYKTPYFVDIAHKNHDLYAYLTRYTGAVISSLETLEYVYNTLNVEHLFNMTLPDWALQIFPDKMKPWAVLSFATDCFTPDLARLKTGLLFGEMIEHFKNETVGDFKKFRIYSGHDTTVANVLNTMGAFEYHSPPYASTVIFEQRRRDNRTTYLNVYYKNTTEARPILVKGCDFDCNLDDFIRILSPITLTLEEWEYECQLSWIHYWRLDELGLAVLISIVGCILIVISAVFLGVKCTKQRRNVSAYTQLPNDEVA